MNELTVRKYFAILFTLLAAVLIGSGLFLAGRVSGVCHAPTEDSNIVDCDYRNGGWHK
jgi:hypothetical protein